jgi:hypothetical protein
MDSIVEKLEQLQEEKENVDVEYSVGPPHHSLRYADAD